MSVLDRRILETLTALAAAHPVLAEARPLALGTREQLIARHPEIEAGLVGQALRKHCLRLRYLKALADGTHRYDLDGEVAGEVTEEQRTEARRRHGEQRALYEAAKARRKAQRQMEQAAAARKVALAVPPSAQAEAPPAAMPGRARLTLKPRRNP